MGVADFTNNKTTNGNPPSGMPPKIPGPPNIEDMLGENIDPVSLLINYNEEFATSGTTLFRDEIVRQTLSILIGKNKPNALLIGPAGVGKTKIAEDIAYRLKNDDPLIPDKLKGYTIYELPISNIVAGSGIVGQTEKKIQAVIDFVEDPNEKAILFIDEIHQLTDSSKPTYQKIAQILKPALARGKMHVIGATTTQEAKDLTDDPAFNRRFSKLIVDELTKDQTVKILENARTSYIIHYGNKINIDNSIMPTIVELADQYKQAGSHRPDNAITLLDRAIADAVINRKIQEIEAKKLADNGDPTVLNMLQMQPFIPVSERQIKSTAIKLATGNSKPDTLDVDHLKEALSRIKGQDDILKDIIKKLRENEMNPWQKDYPFTMLFAGPSGVGKTEVTKIIAKEITGTKPIIINMTEYNSPASINRIIGSPAGYVGSDSHAELPFDSLESNPYQVILLDEFEKSDNAVRTLFMSAFDEGYIKTNRGSTIDFSKCIIIATTNATHTSSKKAIGFGKTTTSNKKAQIHDLTKCLDIALLNRFRQRIYTFHELDKDTYTEIVKETYTYELAVAKKSHKMTISLPDDIDPDALTKIVEDTYMPEFGARPIRDAVREYIMEQCL